MSQASGVRILRTAVQKLCTADLRCVYLLIPRVFRWVCCKLYMYYLTKTHWYGAKYHCPYIPVSTPWQSVKICSSKYAFALRYIYFFAMFGNTDDNKTPKNRKLGEIGVLRIIVEKRLSFSRHMLSRCLLRDVFFAAPQYIRVFNKLINRPNMLKLKYATRALMGVRLFR